MFKNKSILITGGTGSFGKAVLNKLLNVGFKEIIIFSRDELKQELMRLEYKKENLKFYIGDVRDYESILNASKNVNYIFHAAALKQVPSCEFYPEEAYKTNVVGTLNAMNAANSNNVNQKTKFSVVRYGNVIGSRGSVVPFFMEKKKEGIIPITDERMTRFMITLEQAIEIVWFAIDDMEGGEIYVKKIPSMKILDIAEAIAPNVRTKKIGIRPGEKIHEQMIGTDESPYTFEYRDYYKILPAINDWYKDKNRVKKGTPVPVNFSYRSDTNKLWMTKVELSKWITENLTSK